MSRQLLKPCSSFSIKRPLFKLYNNQNKHDILHKINIGDLNLKDVKHLLPVKQVRKIILFFYLFAA